MATAKKERLVLTTPVARLSFCDGLWAKKQVMIGGKPAGNPKFSCCLVFEPAAQQTPEFKTLLNELNKAAFERFGDKLKDAEFIKTVRNPFNRVETKEEQFSMFERGSLFINIGSEYQPLVVDKNRQAIIDKSEVYSGCYVRARVAPYAYDFSAQSRGVNLGMDAIQKVKDGTRIGGGAKAEDFDPLPDEAPSADAAPKSDVASLFR